MRENTPCEKLDWDTEFFGFGVGKVTTDHVYPETLDAIDDFCLENDIRVVFYLAESNNVQAVHNAEDAGYRLVDNRTTLDRELDRIPTMVDSPADYRSSTKEDITILRDIARDVFVYDRFHADPNFDDDLADEMRATWIENMCGELGDRVIIAEVDGRVGGFIALEIDDGVGKIVLTGVDEFAQGDNIGSGLTISALQWFRNQGCETARVVTQSRNIPAQRIYQDLGFKTTESAFWLHKWFE
jgi:dTDP-4-amino-4,6-dideoxy-D-galactose acyltransferase